MGEFAEEAGIPWASCLELQNVEVYLFLGKLTCQDYTKHPKDVVLLVKEWVSSASLSQPPILALPFDYLQRVEGATVEAQPRKALGTRECDEFFA